MHLSGVLLVDLTPAADEFGWIEGRAAANLVPAIPQGVAVELHIGGNAPLDGLLGPLIEELRAAGSITVVGTNPAGVAAVYRALSIAFARTGAA